MKREIRISEDIKIVDNLPAIYIESIDSVVIADLHLGYEGIMAEEGIHIPKVQFEEEMRMLKNITKIKNSKIIINGDYKHKFSPTSRHEFKEIRDSLNFLKENFKQVIVIKGNHDNYIYYMTSKFGVKLYDDFSIGRYFFTHGHRDIELEALGRKTIIVAHEHPVIALYDEIGARETVKCFLFGKTKFGNLLLLPAFSILSYGTEINLVSKQELLSPILKLVDLDEFKVIGVDEEVGILKFGKLKSLKL